MNNLMKSAVKGAAAVGGAYLVSKGLNAVDKDHKILSVDPFAGNTSKTWLWLAGFVAAGALIVSLVGKVTKISVLRA